MSALAGKTILAAGGGSGIGAATAGLLARRGATVLVADLDPVRAREVAARITADGGAAAAYAFDQASEPSIAALVARATEEHGPIHGLFANASDLSRATLHADRAAHELDVAVWMHVLSVNLVGTAALVKHVLPGMLAAGSGAIVCTSSIAAFKGYERPAYAASKAGVNAFVRHLATTYGKRGIRANAIAPGAVLTDATRANLDAAGLSLRLEEVRSPRLGDPADIAAIAGFLLSDEAEWINGQIISVNGGALMP